MKNISFAVALLTVFSARAEKITVGGAEVLSPALREALAAENPALTLSGAGLPELLAGEVDLLFTARYLNAAELRQARRLGVTAHPFTFAYDGLAVIVSGDSPLTEISRVEVERGADVELARVSLLKDHLQGRRILPVDGLLPTSAAVQGRSYPYIQGVYVYTRGLPEGGVREAIRYLTGPKARKIIMRHGMVPGR
ncbi:MAG: hypothetical protein LBD30_02615 [Verrucomicrobiales bacterium]|jgi:ABC-type phosphate transport system substrate-binding protein|nr:hypothetical protein [Verrucomicrobiales bacterium]